MHGENNAMLQIPLNPRIKLQSAIFPWSKHVIRFHELPAYTMQCIYKLLKKVWIITFALIFCTYFFIIFTWFLHFLRDSSFPYILA